MLVPHQALPWWLTWCMISPLTMLLNFSRCTSWYPMRSPWGRRTHLFILMKRVLTSQGMCPNFRMHFWWQEWSILKRLKSLKGRDLEKRLKSMKGFSTLKIDDMCLVLDLVIPSKFKVPNFEKYTGDSFPRHHLVMFCRRITSYTHNDKLMIHYFQYSLSEASLSWYMKLERSHIQSWENLANAFLKQYNYNLDIAPDWRKLQSLSQKSNKSFRWYGQRWREFAAQV